MQEIHAIRFHLRRLRGRCGKGIPVLLIGQFQNRAGDQEADKRGNGDTCNNADKISFWGQCKVSEDRTGRRSGHQSGIKELERHDAAGSTADHCQNRDWLHQDVREVHLVNTAQEVNDNSPRSRALGRSLSKNRVRKKQPKTGARI